MILKLLLIVILQITPLMSSAIPEPSQPKVVHRVYSLEHVEKIIADMKASGFEHFLVGVDIDETLVFAINRFFTDIKLIELLYGKVSNISALYWEICNELIQHIKGETGIELVEDDVKYLMECETLINKDAPQILANLREKYNAEVFGLTARDADAINTHEMLVKNLIDPDSFSRHIPPVMEGVKYVNGIVFTRSKGIALMNYVRSYCESKSIEPDQVVAILVDDSADNIKDMKIAFADSGIEHRAIHFSFRSTEFEEAYKNQGHKLFKEIFLEVLRVYRQDDIDKQTQGTTE